MDDGLVLAMLAPGAADIDVLILVVVEDGLVPRRNEVCLQWSKVLILIVVEDGLVRHLVTMFSLMLKKVLILVVVDDGLVLISASVRTNAETS